MCLRFRNEYYPPTLSDPLHDRSAGGSGVPSITPTAATCFLNPSPKVMPSHQQTSFLLFSLIRTFFALIFFCTAFSDLLHFLNLFLTYSSLIIRNKLP